MRELRRVAVADGPVRTPAGTRLAYDDVLCAVPGSRASPPAPTVRSRRCRYETVRRAASQLEELGIVDVRLSAGPNEDLPIARRVYPQRVERWQPAYRLVRAELGIPPHTAVA